MLIPIRSPACHLEVMYFFSTYGSLKEKNKKKIIWRVMDLMLMGWIVVPLDCEHTVQHFDLHDT